MADADTGKEVVGLDLLYGSLSLLLLCGHLRLLYEHLSRSCGYLYMRCSLNICKRSSSKYGYDLES